MIIFSSNSQQKIKNFFFVATKRTLISFCFLLSKDNRKVKKVKKFFEKGKNKMQFSSLSERNKVHLLKVKYRGKKYIYIYCIAVCITRNFFGSHLRFITEIRFKSGAGNNGARTVVVIRKTYKQITLHISCPHLAL